jgi:haloalkane dehalogenase
MSDAQSISADFPFESRFVEVLGSKIHYVEEGSGDPIIFMHGNPTYSYLWRNVIPHLTSQGRCIAFDMIGMGKSDKPKIGYRFSDHYRYFEGFIAALDLKNITFVVHDWGSALGFHYARQHEDNVKALAFFESFVRPLTWSDVPAAYRMGFRMMRMTGIGWLLVCVLNIFIKQIMPGGAYRKLTDEEKRQYAAPFPTIASRQAVRQWPREIPISGKPADNTAVVSAFSQWLQETDLPKLLLYATPGAITTPEITDWCKQHLKNLKTVDLGKGLHFLQEDYPHEIGAEIAAWHAALK